MRFTFGNVDRGIYEVIRKEVVRLGYCPDIALYPGDPDGYESAKDILRNSGKKIIEVIGVGDPKQRNESHYNTIYINRDDLQKGTLGFFGTKFFVERTEPNPTPHKVYDAYMNGSGTIDLQYRVEFFTDDTLYDRIIQTAIFNSMKVKGFVKGINDDASVMSRGFNTQYQTTIDKSGSDYLEREMRYFIPDIAIEDATFLYTTTRIEETDLTAEAFGSIEELNNEVNPPTP